MDWAGSDYANDFLRIVWYIYSISYSMVYLYTIYIYTYDPSQFKTPIMGSTTKLFLLAVLGATALINAFRHLRSLPMHRHSSSTLFSTGATSIEDISGRIQEYLRDRERMQLPPL